MIDDRKDMPLACMLLFCGSGIGIGVAAGAPSPAPPASAPVARTALTYNPLRRCPDLRIAGEDDQDFARVVFLVGPSGVPSHPSLLSRSASQELDAAAMSCVLKLRFQPATRLGEGTAVESWQEIRWKWAPKEHPTGASTVSQSLAGAASSLAQAGGSATPSAANATSAAGDVAERPLTSPGNRAQVRVCVDARGRLTGEPTLTRPSGDSGFDAAAIAIAKSGSGLYRAGNAEGKTAAGCLQLAIGPGGQ